MIEIKNANKKFGAVKAIDNLTCKINDASIFGVVGSNGAGKSTLLRVISGVYSLDSGSASLGDKKIYNNPAAKGDILFLSDTPLASFGMTLEKLAKEYTQYYKNFDKNEYHDLLKIFKLDKHMPLSGFSKGMLRQAMIIIALSCNTKYLVMDETLDGLDAMIRGLVKKKIYKKVLDKGTTVIISSHSLRELEDFCDSLILIHKGNLIFRQQIESMETTLIKVQAAFKDGCSEDLFPSIDVVKFQKTGTVCNMLVRGKEDEIVSAINKLNPLLLEVLPLTLEEIFTYELQERGYAIDLEEISALRLEDK